MKLIKSESGNYSVRFRDVNGSQRSTNLRTKDKKEARQLIKDLKIEELENAGKIGVLSSDVITKIIGSKSMKYKDVLKEYEQHMRLSANSDNSIYTMMSIYDQFGRDYKLNDKPMAMINESNIFNFINADDGTSLGNRALRRSSLNQLWNFAQIKMYVITNPIMFIKIDKSKLLHNQKTPKKKRVFKEAEVDKMIKHAPYFFRQAIAISYWTGLRLGDIASLEWASIKDRNRMVVWTEKRDKMVSIDTTNENFGGGILKKVLSEIDVEDEIYCFPEWHKDTTDPKKRSKASVYFSRFCERLNIVGRSFHSLRHSCITRLEKQGLSLEEIGKAVGHSNTKTTEGYVHK